MWYIKIEHIFHLPDHVIAAPFASVLNTVLRLLLTLYASSMQKVNIYLRCTVYIIYILYLVVLIQHNHAKYHNIHPADPCFLDKCDALTQVRSCIKGHGMTGMRSDVTHQPLLFSPFFFFCYLFQARLSSSGGDTDLNWLLALSAPGAKA